MNDSGLIIVLNIIINISRESEMENKTKLSWFKFELKLKCFFHLALTLI